MPLYLTSTMNQYPFSRALRLGTIMMLSLTMRDFPSFNAVRFGNSSNNWFRNVSDEWQMRAMVSTTIAACLNTYVALPSLSAFATEMIKNYRNKGQPLIERYPIRLCPEAFRSRHSRITKGATTKAILLRMRELTMDLGKNLDSGLSS